MTKAKRIRSSTDGLKLAYWLRPADTGADRYLLLIHGGASNHTRWSEFVDTTGLTARWNVIYPDMRGNGASLTRGPQNVALWCADLRDLLVAEGAESAVIVGHSLGAQIALQFAHRHAQKTRGLVLIDPLFHSALQGRQRRLHRFRWLLKAAIAVIGVLNALGLYRRRIRDRDLRELDEETRLALRGAESFQEIARRYGALGPILRHMPTNNYLRQVLETVGPLPPLSAIEAPVLALLSAGTTLADLAITRAEIAGFPDNETVTLEANHWPLTETPEAVRAAIEAWISRRFE